MKEMVGGCCVCSDDRGWDENPLVYCDGHGCNVAVHQACYGIIEVPKGPWFCRKCESQERAARVRCELCPQRTGALKRSDLGGWCHVVCALFIPEAWFLNVQTMEPIVLKSVPAERFNKVCYVCDENKMESKATQGACMACNKAGCKNHFHVTCAQAHGLLCEEAGSNGDSVKYCGYCIHHYKKLKKDSHIKQIPAFKPVLSDSKTPESSPDKTRENGETKLKLSGVPMKTKAETRHVSPTPLATTTPLPLEPEPLHSSPQSDSAWKLSTLKSRALHEQKLTLEAKRAAAASSSNVTSPPSVISSTLSSTTSVTTTISSTKPATSTFSSPPATATPKPSSQTKTPNSISPPNITSSTYPSSKFEKFLTSPASSNEAPILSTDNSQDSSGKRKPDKTSEKTEKKAAKKRRKAQRRRESEMSSLTSPDSPVIDPVSESTMPILTAVSTTGHTTLSNCLPAAVSQSVFGGEPIFHSLSSQPATYVHTSTKSETDSHTFDIPPTTSDISTFSTVRTFGTSVTPSSQSTPTTIDSTHLSDFPTTFEELLDRHVIQGNQFLINQAAEFDLSALLTSLNQLRTENQRLGQHVKALSERRDHLTTVNNKLTMSLQPYPQEPSAMGDSHAPRLSSSSDSSQKTVKSNPKNPNSRPSSAHQPPQRSQSPPKGSRKTSSASPDIRLTNINANSVMPNSLQLTPLTEQQRAHYLQTNSTLQPQSGLMIQRPMENSSPFMYPVLGGSRSLPHHPNASIISAIHSYPVTNNSLPLSASLHLQSDSKAKDKT